MVLNEDALEAMIRRQNEAAAAQKGARSKLAEQTDEFEVYERPKEETPEVAVDSMPEPMVQASHVSEEFEEFNRAPEPVSEMEYQAPVEQEFVAPEPAHAAIQEISSFRDSFAPEPVRAPTHAPAPQMQETVSRTFTQPPRIAVVQARFNEELTGPMAELAKGTIAAQGGVLHCHKTVAGVYDLPLLAQSLARRHDVDAVVVLGVVVQGSTKHDEIITHCTAKTLQQISLETQTPIGLGITGPGMTWEQAEARMGNAAHAVEAVLELLEAL